MRGPSFVGQVVEALEYLEYRRFDARSGEGLEDGIGGDERGDLRRSGPVARRFASE